MQNHQPAKSLLYVLPNSEYKYTMPYNDKYHERVLLKALRHRLRNARELCRIRSIRTDKIKRNIRQNKRKYPRSVQNERGYLYSLTNFFGAVVETLHPHVHAAALVTCVASRHNVAVRRSVCCQTSRARIRTFQCDLLNLHYCLPKYWYQLLHCCSCCHRRS